MKTEMHTVYKLKDGKRVPGVTTITRVLDKPALLHWAWELGTRGTDYKNYRDDKAAQGTLAHAMILGHLTGEKPDTSDYSVNQIDAAENSFLSYLEWERGKKIEPILVEKPLVSESLKYGGTPDFYGKIDGIHTLLDFKTGKAVYDEAILQVAAYDYLIEENGGMADQWKILRIGRDENEGFEVRDISSDKLDIALGIFRDCLRIYDGMKRLKKEG